MQGSHPPRICRTRLRLRTRYHLLVVCLVNNATDDTPQGYFLRGVSSRMAALLVVAIVPAMSSPRPCRARLRLHAQTVSQAGSMLPEFPASCLLYTSPSPRD